MSPDRLKALLTITFTACAVPLCLRPSLAQQARAQLQQRYPLAGCGVTQGDGSTRVIVVGRH